ncbi:FimV family protein [Bordetella pseudohinzii]|uniref:type IV pilus assembly protein FimV n=1 Tax=Bordetella pseudohinzii TaxID=1331258 RepID=UPI00045B603A|nr:FimV/HubP family polar landmark protein [Bordetella pseudohinzii]KMM25569.1 membrane protein [Bordetella pseudohinzii]
MSSRHSQHRLSPQICRKRGLALALAMALGATWGWSAQAARLGHARVVSAPGEPLRVALPLTELSPDEAQSLQVSLADAADWQRAGLTPPAPLSSLSLQTQASRDSTRRDLLMVSPQPMQGDAVDVLLNLRTSAGQRLVQVTVLVPKGAPKVQPAQLGAARPAAAQAGGSSVHVRRGDTLYNIAQRHPVAGANIHQMLVALWRANPNAFIGDNMNRLKAGADLALPDADTVRAIDPAEARRIYIEQVEAYARYRAGLGQAAGGTRVSAGAASAGKVGGGDTPAGASAASSQDRLRLSGAPADADAKGDSKASDAHALADARGRVDTLQSNVEALKQAGAGRDGASDGAVGAAGKAAGAAAAALAGASPAPKDAENAGAAPADGAGQQADAAKGAASAPAGGGAAAPGAATGAAASGGTPGQNAAGPAGQPAAPAGDTAGDKAAANKPADASGLPAWLADNLLAIVTAVLALLVLVIAFALRRAGTRRDEDNEESPYSEAPRLDDEALNKRLHTINLDLDQPPPDEPGRRT